MSLINDYRRNDEEFGILEVPNINVATPQQPVVEPAPQPSLGSLGEVNPSGTVASVGTMQGSTDVLNPEMTTDYKDAEQAALAQVEEQNQQQLEDLQTKNAAQASSLQLNENNNLATPSFGGAYDFAADNAKFDGILRNAKELANQRQVALTNNINTAQAQEQKGSEDSWLNKALGALNYGTNVLTGATYDAMNLPNVVGNVIGQASDKLKETTGIDIKPALGVGSFLVNNTPGLPQAIGKAQEVYGMVAGASEKLGESRNNATFEWTDLLPTVKFDSKRSYTMDAVRGADLSVTGTDIQDVGKVRKSPIAVVNPKLDNDNAWKNPTRYAGYAYDFVGGGVVGIGAQGAVAKTVGKAVGAISKSAKAARVATTTTNIVLDPAGEALSGLVGIGIRGIKGATRPKGSVAPTTSIPTEASISLVNVPPTNVKGIATNSHVTTLRGSGTVISVNAETKTVTYKPDGIDTNTNTVTYNSGGKLTRKGAGDSVTETITVKLDELTAAPTELVVGKAPKGGVALPMVTPTKRASIPLADNNRRLTTSIRDVDESALKVAETFSMTQPSITPYRLPQLPPSVVPTEVPGVVSSAASRLAFIKQQSALGVKVDPNEVKVLTSSSVLPDDIPQVDVRVFTGTMSYADLSSVISQQVAGTQVDVGALFQVPRSTEDLHALARTMGFKFASDVPVTSDELLEYIYEQAPSNVDAKNVFNNYGAPVPTALKEATDIRVNTQESVPFKQPEADVVIRQAPTASTTKDAAEFFSSNTKALADFENKLPFELRTGDAAINGSLLTQQLEVENIGSLTKTLRENLEQVNNNLELSTERVLETPDIGRKYDPELKTLELVRRYATRFFDYKERLAKLEKENLEQTGIRANNDYRNLLHGSRVQNLESIDAVLSSERDELGTGFYLTTKPELAKSTALAEVKPNLPAANRVYGEPHVSSYALAGDAIILDTAQEVSPSIVSAFKGFVSPRQLSGAKTVQDLFDALDKRMTNGNYSESKMQATYAAVSDTLRDVGYSAIKNSDTLNVLDTSKLKLNYKQELEASGDVLESVAHRFNVDSHRAATNPKNIQAQVNFEESSVRLQAEMKGKLESDLEEAELKQHNAVTKLLDEQQRIEASVTQKQNIEEQSRTLARVEKSQADLQKLYDENTNPDPCLP